MNEVHWYNFGSHTMNLLDEKYRQYNHDIDALMLACGYSPKRNNKQRFLKHQKQWNCLSRNIPKAYLAALNINIKDIEKAIKLDQQLYQKALSELVLDYCELGNHIGHFRGIISESEAIDILKIYATKRKSDCKINIKHLKTISIKADGCISIIEYRPELRISKAQIAFMTNPLLGQISHSM